MITKLIFREKTKVNNGIIPNYSFDSFFQVFNSKSKFHFLYHLTHPHFHWVRQLWSDIFNHFHSFN